MSLELLCLHCHRILSVVDGDVCVNDDGTEWCSYCQHGDFMERRAIKEFDRDAMRTI